MAKATQRWNVLLAERFAAGFGEVWPSYGSVLLPLDEADGVRMGELARQAHLSRQLMIELIRRLERDGLVERRPDPAYARASLIFLTAHSAGFCRWPPPSSVSLIGWRERPDPREVAELKAPLTELVDLG